MDPGRSIQHEISSLKGTPRSFLMFCFLRLLSSPSCAFRTALFSHNPSLTSSSYRCSINRKSSDSWGCGVKWRDYNPVLARFRHSFVDKRDEKLLFPFVSRRDHRAAPGVRGNNCAETACFTSRCCRRLVLLHAAHRVRLMQSRWAAAERLLLLSHSSELATSCPALQSGLRLCCRKSDWKSRPLIGEGLHAMFPQARGPDTALVLACDIISVSLVIKPLL